MKAKWWLSFMGLFGFAFPPPPDMAVRVVRASAFLICVAVLLVVIKPWRRDDGSDEFEKLRVGGLR